MSQPTLLGLSGSLRQDASNRKLLREAARLFDPTHFVEADLNLPLYDGDLEEGEGIPAAVQSLADQIAQADAVIISTPEYNKGPSGVLKNALDWVSRTQGNPWADKPVAVMSAAAGRAGGERAQMILRSFMVPFQPRILQGPEIHLANSSNEFDEHGKLASERYEKSLHKLMQKLRAEAGI
ncbi:MULTISPECIES: NADPH-dependent FMN reductase [unclassified Ruegeria]|uniref:NADPH-dependent FMN reductase n=1 Tax=unclassified Ruegeria TaxID=2625375 RepID=UPI0014912082|nr:MULTISPECIES: NAD(P)H-dependent oxidoreductase [unclassified Ruegeria]NOD32973.1 NADPH-dependent FMN reductase [Ruegeria sp. HKCCD7296]NOE42687.1 NADPH-dependent FMN reductase [Ruegeria sp. HKCCD7319]